VVGFPGANELGDKSGPLVLPEILETARPGDVDARDFRQLAVIAEEVRFGRNMNHRDLQICHGRP